MNLGTVLQGQAGIQLLKHAFSISRNNKDKKKKLAKISSGLSFNIDGEDEDVDEDDIEPAGM
jgi:hypothetical protein